MRNQSSSPLAGTDPGNPDPDLVPGEPPVPITVWRTPTHPDDSFALLPDSLVRQLADAFTRPGDRLLDLTGFDLFGCVTDTRFVKAGILHQDRVQRVGRRLPDPGSVALVAACWPPPGTGDQQLDTAVTLMRDARRCLRSGGVLTLLAANPPGLAPADYGPVVAAADAAGLGYLQHIAAVRTPVTGDRIAATTAAAGQREDDVVNPVVVHTSVHADVFVFAARGGVDG